MWIMRLRRWNKKDVDLRDKKRFAMHVTSHVLHALPNENCYFVAFSEEMTYFYSFHSIDPSQIKTIKIHWNIILS